MTTKLSGFVVLTSENINEIGNPISRQVRTWTPFVLQNVEADASEFIDVWVIDFRQKAHFRRRHRVVFAEEQFEFENAACCFRIASVNGEAIIERNTTTHTKSIVAISTKQPFDDDDDD